LPFLEPTASLWNVTRPSQISVAGGGKVIEGPDAKGRQGIISHLSTNTAHQAPAHCTLSLATTTSRQIFRFALVGVGVNVLLYAAYLTLVGLQVDVKVAMSLAYVGGVVLGFVLNRRWTFGRLRRPCGDVPAYLTVYLAGYLLTLGALVLFVDGMGWAHQAVQGAMVFIVAALAFVLQKYWVFRASGWGAEPRL
jgi:putative flippase GtrA